MPSTDELAHLVEAITTDCYVPAEQTIAFYEVFLAEVSLPASASIVGTSVEVIGVDLDESGEQLVARCRRGDADQDLHLVDLIFPADTPAAWIQAAYRRCLGLRPYPTAMPKGWLPSWL